MSFEKALLKLPPGQRLLAKKKKQAERGLARRYIRSLLQNRFGDTPIEFIRQLRRIENQKKLDQLLQLAAMCPDLATFQAGLEKA